MKKLAKYLVLLLVVALLGGILAVAAFAEETTTTPWTPTDDAATADVDESTIYYAVWASEDDYLSGTVDPIKTNLTDEIDQETNKGLTGAMLQQAGLTNYVVFFDDVTWQDTAAFYQKNLDIVLNFNGHSMTSSKNFRYGYYGDRNYPCTMTMKNGTWTFTSGQIRPEYGSSLTFENMTINGTQFGYCSGGDLTFKDCAVTLSGQVPFKIGQNYGTQKVSFIGTQLELTNTAIGTMDKNNLSGIFSTKNFSGWEYGFEILFDSESSLTCATENALWLGHHHFKDTTEAYTGTTIYLEEGFAVTSSLVDEPTTDFIGMYYEAVDSTSENYQVYVDDATVLSVKVVVPGTTEEIANWILPTNAAGLAVLTGFNGEGYVIYDEATDSYGVVDTLAGYTFVKYDESGDVIVKTWTDTTVSAADFDVDALVYIDSTTGEAYAGDYWYLYNKTTDVYTVITSLDGLTDYELDETGKIVYVPWSPDDTYTGILYGVWASEEDYKLGIAPDYWYQNADSTAANYTTTMKRAHVGTTDDNGTIYGVSGYVPGYVRLYQSTEILKADGQMIIGQTQKLIIDLNNQTLTMNNAFRIGGSSYSHPDASLELRNGELVHINGQLQPRQDTTLKMKDIVWQVNVANFLYDAGCATLELDGCTVNINKQGAYMMISLDTSSGVKAINFIDTDFVADYISAPVFEFTYAIGKTINEYAVVNFDKDCTIDAFGTPFFQMNRAPSNTGTYGAYTVPTIINFEQGFQATANVLSGKYLESYTNHSTPASSLNSLNNYKTIAGESDTTLKMNVTSGGTAIADWYAVRQESGMVKIVDSFDPTLYKIIEWAPAFGTTEERIANRVWTEAVISESTLLHADGSVIKFYDDAEISALATFYDYDLTFELNGFTVTYTNGSSLQFGKGEYANIEQNISGKVLPRTIIFKNGNLNFTLASSALQPRPGTELYFEKVDINTHQHLLNDGGATVVSLKDCTVKAANGANIATRAVGVADTDAEYIIDNTKLINFAVLNVSGARAYDVTLTIKGGSVLDNRYVILRTEGDTSTGADETPMKNATVKIALDTKFIRGYDVPYVVVGGTNNTATISFYEDIDGEAVGNGSDYALYLAGNLALDEDTNVDYYMLAARPTVGNALRVNLSLFTDFNVNFFANGGVEGILRDGTALTATTYVDGENSYDKYVITLNAHEAADAVSLVVLYNDGEKTFYLPLEYSVLTYANKLVATDGVSAEAVTLAKAAVAYIKEAYYIANADVESYTLPADLAAFDSAVTPADAGTAELTTLTEAVASVRFELESSVNLVLTIANDYNG
ncbi:MAG: hypothetical protein IJW48_03510, partial [Clostridia bacterium]|nr:hypothetical protein [Clostridia bacterium]